MAAAAGLLPSVSLTRPRSVEVSKSLIAHRPLGLTASSFPSQSFSIRNNAGFAAKASLVKEVEVLTKVKKLENPIVVIDNYDSFTYNLCQYMGELGCNFEVYRNDDLTVEELARRNPSGILISPGPGTPQDSGISLETVFKLGPLIPIFGVCMGLQCIGEAFGGKVVRSPYGVVHGKSSLVSYDEKGEDGLFTGLPNSFCIAFVVISGLAEYLTSFFFNHDSRPSH